MEMREAVIVDAARTPGGRRNGKLQDWHAADLGAHVLKAIAERNNLDPSTVDGPRRCPQPPLIASVVRASKRCISQRKVSSPGPTTSSSLQASKS